MPNLSIPLGIESLKILSQTVDIQGKIIIDVESTKTSTTCHRCGQLANKKYGHGEFLTVQHLPILDQKVFLRIRVVRYQCSHCEGHPISSEKYDWMERKSKTTKGFDRYINRQLINSTVEDVSKKEGVSYDSVESTIHRCVNTSVDWTHYFDLKTIGIDEISVLKGHKDYVVIVSSKDKNDNLSVIAVLPNRLKETVKEFLESIPEHLKKTVESVCTDMCDSYVNAAAEIFGKRLVVIDRYHVSKLYREPLDDLRISEMKRLKKEISSEEYSKLDNMMWIIRKKHECVTKDEKDQIELLYKYSPKLKEMHSAALKLTHIFNTHHSRKEAMNKMNRWISSVQKSGLSEFSGFIKTLTKYKTTILNYFKKRMNSGFVEGLNNKIKVLKRRCYGISKADTFFQRLFLDLKGYDLFA
jgi:transposase